jgi:hypothetical protein
MQALRSAAGWNEAMRAALNRRRQTTRTTFVAPVQDKFRAGATCFKRVNMKLPSELRVRSAGIRPTISTVEQALTLIDQNLPPELARLPRWTFARALLVEAMRTGKSRDMNTAVRQLRQALSNEKWLDESPAD